MGCMNVVESELLELAQVDFRSNLLNLDLQEVSRRLARHPWVEKANVRRDFSGKALIIEVQERVPRALILLDELYLVDRNGEIFKKAEPKEKLDFPILTGVSLQEWKQKDPKTMELIHQALELLESLEGQKIFSPAGSLRDPSEQEKWIDPLHPERRSSHSAGDGGFRGEDQPAGKGAARPEEQDAERGVPGPSISQESRGQNEKRGAGESAKILNAAKNDARAHRRPQAGFSGR